MLTVHAETGISCGCLITDEADSKDTAYGVMGRCLSVRWKIPNLGQSALISSGRGVLEESGCWCSR